MPVYSKAVTKSIAAENTFSDWIELKGRFNFSLSGTFSATVHVQRSFDDGATELDVDSFTMPCEQQGFEAEDGVKYRFGVKTGNYSSGPAVGRLSQ